MKLADKCKKRQDELLRILSSIDDDRICAGDGLATERLKQTAQKAISQYEKILHLLKGEQIGHA